MRAENGMDDNNRESGAKAATEIFDTDHAITFQIVVLSNLIARPFHSFVGRHAPISLNDWRLMLVIAARPGLSQSEIVYYTGFNKSNVSRQLNGLGTYVRLATHPTDNRKQAAYLTDAGWDLYNLCVPALHQRLQFLTQSLPAEELQQFQDTLQKLTHRARMWSTAAEEDALPDH